jgi:hypothetical protein
MIEEIFKQIDVMDYQDKNKTVMGELNRKLQELRNREEEAGKFGLLPIKEMKNIYFSTMKEFRSPFT